MTQTTAPVEQVRDWLQSPDQTLVERFPDWERSDWVDVINVLAEEEEGAVAVFCGLPSDLGARVIGDLSEEALRLILREASPSCLGKVCALLTTEDERIPPAFGELVPDLSLARQLAIFQALPRSLGAEVFAQMERSARDDLVHAFSDADVRRLLADLMPDDRTDLFKDLPGEITQRLLNLLPPEELQEARRLLGYPEDSVGRLMTPRYVAVRPEWTVAKTLEHLRRQSRRHRETFDVIYVVDRRWRLLDALDLRTFVFADPDSTVSELMDEAFVSISVEEDQEEAVAAMRRFDVSVLPVVDADGILVGIVTFDDILDVAEEESTEDFHRVAGVAPLRGSYLQTRLIDLFRKRVGWLVILVFMNIFSGHAIASFEDTIAATIALVFFLPLLIDSGGNAGSQASTLMVRALATGDVKLGDWYRIVGKDLMVSFCMGIAMSVAVWTLAYFRAGIDVAWVVSISMLCIVMVGSTIGTILPFILTKLRLDPATASSPLITSIADITGVILYLSIATLLLPQVVGP